MKRCWDMEANQRPDFSNLVKYLQKALDQQLEIAEVSRSEIPDPVSLQPSVREQPQKRKVRLVTCIKGPVLFISFLQKKRRFHTT